MPLLRYFVFVGGALFALLLIVNAALPGLPVTESSQPAATDLSIIRINSDRKWPERIVFDTTRPTVAPSQAPAAPAIAEAPQPRQSAAVEPPKTREREAFAQLRTNQNEVREPRRKRKAVARNRVAQPPMYYGSRPFVVAQQPRFGFFGNNVW